jgi:hypothetical protein
MNWYTASGISANRDCPKASYTLPSSSADGVKVTSSFSFHFDGQTSV